MCILTVLAALLSNQVMRSKHMQEKYEFMLSEKMPLVFSELAALMIRFHRFHVVSGNDTLLSSNCLHSEQTCNSYLIHTAPDFIWVLLRLRRPQYPYRGKRANTSRAPTQLRETIVLSIPHAENFICGLLNISEFSRLDR